MAMKRCPDCGEKYSDSYKYCPFCEEEEILKEGKGRGSRRARQSRGFSVLTPVLIILILLMAGLLMFLLRSDKQPTEPVTPQPGAVTPVQPDDSTDPDHAEDPDGTEDPDGDAADPGVMPDETDPNPTVPATNPDTTGSGTAAGGEATVVNAATGVNVRPDPSTGGTPIASLKNGDKVKVVKDAGNGWYEITFSGPGGRDTTGYMKGDFLSTTAGSASSGTTGSSTSGTTTSGTAGSSTSGTTSGTGSTSASSGSLKTGSGKVTNAAGGVYVRPGPSASGTPVASLKNGDAVQIVKSAGDGWYEITFTGSGGRETSGYMKGDYLTNG